MAHPIDHHQAANDRSMFGFWVYLMTDLLMFAVLFAVYAVLKDSTAGGPSGKELFNLPLVLVGTLLLLTSSFTCGLGMIAVRQKNKNQIVVWFGATFALGLAFLITEAIEFSHLIGEGHTMGTSAFLSSFFLLVGTHGLHIIIGLMWLAAIFIYTKQRGLTSAMQRKFGLLSLYWHFLDIVWIFIFTLVYLGAFV